MVNRKKLSVLAVVCGLIALSSCSIGLDPAKETQTSVALHLHQLSLPDGSAAGRAIIQGSGSLFIRTVGGPIGTLGPLYGPYPVSAGGTFETTDIPAGTYSKIVVLFCASPDPALIPLLSLPDPDFLNLIISAAPIDDIIDGSGSQKVLDNVELKIGVRNTLNITMMPIVSSVSSIADVSLGSYDLQAVSSAMNHKFIQLTNLSSMVSGGNKMKELLLTVTPTTSATVGVVALYNAAGVLVPGSSFSALGPIAASHLYTIPYGTSAPCYMYIEYQAVNAPTLEFDHTEELIPSYAITFDKNDAVASGATPSQSILENTSQSLNPNGFTKSGYVFAGWSLASGGGVAYLDGAAFPMGTSNVTLYAKWTALSAAKAITSFGFASPAATGVITGTNIAVTVPNGTDVTALQASFATTGQTVSISGIPQVSGTTANNFASMITYTVYAANGTYQNYFVTVTILPSTDATLSNLVPVAFTMNETFLPATQAYTSDANNSISLVMIRPTSTSPAAKIEFKINSGSYAILTSGSTSPSMFLDSVNGINVISVRVTAQDNVTIKTYTITVNKTVLVDINTVGGGTLTPMGSLERTPGSVVPLVATPTAGYRFVSWTGGGSSVAAPTSATTTLTVPPNNVTLLANFTPDFAGGDGSIGSPYEITTLAQLKNVNNFLTPAYYFKVMAPIDLSSEANWTPLGNTTNKFIGNFDGNNQTISNLKITSGSVGVGFFGVTNGATIQNVHLTNINISNPSGNYVGGLVGNTEGTTTINDSYVTGVVNGLLDVGGLVGNNDTGFTLNVTGCWTDVEVTTNSSNGNFGGLIGSTKGGLVSKCYAIGNVGPHAGNPTNVGGLIGMSMDTSLVTDCYAKGAVYGGNYVGGLLGTQQGTAQVDRCYSIGLVTSGGSEGGLIGYNMGTVNDCYYDLETSGMIDAGSGDPTSTVAMQTMSTFQPAWDFLSGTPVWKIAASEYPKLYWQP